jgi:hypothetical protein
MNKCKDCMGHTLKIGDYVDVLPPQNMKWIGRITEASDGGISLSIDKGNRGVTPAIIRVVLDITLQANPQLAVFPGLTKTSPPGSDDVIDKIMEAAKEEPPPSSPITM